MCYAAFLIMRDVRGLDLPEVVVTLSGRLAEQGCDFDGRRSCGCPRLADGFA